MIAMIKAGATGLFAVGSVVRILTQVDVTALPAPSPPAQVLFFPLDESFDECVPLTAACPQDSSTLLLVPVARRPITWAPEAADLEVRPVARPPLPAVGSAPGDGAHVLVPALDAERSTVVHLPRLLDRGMLIDDPAPGPEPLVPRLDGPSLVAGAPTGRAPAAIVERPEIVEASALDDAAPVLVARRAVPSRVILAIVPDREWGLPERAVPLVSTSSIAVAARLDGRAGLAVALPSGVTTVAAGEPRATGGARAELWTAVVAGAAALVAVVAVRLRRRPGKTRPIR